MPLEGAAGRGPSRTACADRHRQDRLGHDLQAGRSLPPPAPKRPWTDRLETHRQHKAARAADRPGRQRCRSTPAGPPRPRPASRSQPSAPGPQEAVDRPARDAPAAQGRTGRRSKPGRQRCRSTPAGPPRPRPASRSQPSAPGPQEAVDRPARDAPAAQGRTGRRSKPGRQRCRSTPAGPGHDLQAGRSLRPGPQEADRPARDAPAAQGRTGRRSKPGRQRCRSHRQDRLGASRSQLPPPAPKRPWTDRLETHRQHKAARAADRSRADSVADRHRQDRLGHDLQAGRSLPPPAPKRPWTDRLETHRQHKAARAADRSRADSVADRHRQDRLGHDLQAGRSLPPPAPKRPWTDRLETHRQHKAARAADRSRADSVADRHRQDRLGHDLQAGRSLPPPAPKRPWTDRLETHRQHKAARAADRSRADSVADRHRQDRLGHDLQAGRSLPPPAPKRPWTDRLETHRQRPERPHRQLRDSVPRPTRLRRALRVDMGRDRTETPDTPQAGTPRGALGATPAAPLRRRGPLLGIKERGPPHQEQPAEPEAEPVAEKAGWTPAEPDPRTARAERRQAC